MAHLRAPHLCSLSRDQQLAAESARLSQPEIFSASASHSSHPALHQLSFSQLSSPILGDVKVGIVSHRGADIIPAADGGTWNRALY